MTHAAYRNRGTIVPPFELITRYQKCHLGAICCDLLQRGRGSARPYEAKRSGRIVPEEGQQGLVEIAVAMVEAKRRFLKMQVERMPGNAVELEQTALGAAP
jgi:hypothetical protein